MNTISWFNATGYEASTIRMLVLTVLIAFLLLMAGRTAIALFEATVHSQLSPGQAIRYLVRIVMAVVLFIVIFWR